MKALNWLLITIVVSLLAFGCGKKSGIEGKIVGGKGQPIANVKITATQVQPIKGYEQFEATTGSDGTFRFSKLFPTSEYILFPWAEGWETEPGMTLLYEPANLRVYFYKGGWRTERKMTVQSGPEGQTLLLSAPIVVQPAISTVKGKIVDGKGEPIPNVKMVAKHSQPIKGYKQYEQFETATGSDGTFRFGKLFPNSEYVLFPRMEDWTPAPMWTLRYKANKLKARFNKDGWTTKQKMKVQTGLEGQTILLASPIVIQPCLSSLKGKVVDGKGRPLAKINVITKKVQPVAGYEKLETTTGSDGTFRFGKLFPNSEYVLFPQIKDWTIAPMWTLRYKANKLVSRFSKEGWTTEQKMKVQTGLEGQTILLASPIVIQPCLSSLKGKVVDGKGRPLANIKVIAKQVRPVTGYEQFQATTGSDGKFRFAKLFPSSEYILLPHSEDWKTSVNKTVRSGPEEESLKLKSPLVIRFTMSKAGVITDSRTGLQWAPDPGPMDWYQANAYAQNLKLGGYDDWRLPTIAELRSLYDKSLKTEYKIDPLFRHGAFSVWSSELKDSRYMRTFYFPSGCEGSMYRVAGSYRTLVVRSPK